MDRNDMDTAKTLYLQAQFDRAFLLFKRQAQSGNAEAMYFLGEYYAQAYGHLSQDMDKALAWRKKGAAGGNVLAKLNTAYHMPAGSAKRVRLEAELLPVIRSLSEEGDVFAMNELGDMYLYGFGTRKNPEQAVYWMEKANFWRTLNKLGEMYAYGEGVAKDPARAKKYFERAAATGYGDAEGNLAMAWYHGEKPDRLRAFAWLRRAYAHGALFDGEIANMLGIMSIEGQGVKMDKEEGFAWLLRSAAKRSAAGMHHLSLCYERGIGTGENRERAVFWAKRAADKGHLGAMVRYGIFQREKGEPKEAFRYFKRAAEQGDPDGEVWYASCFLYGLGTEENKETAKEWLLRAAAQGEENAVHLLREELGVDWHGV